MPPNDKNLDLDEARRQKRIARFIRERRSTGDESMFDNLLHAMAKGGKRGDDPNSKPRRARPTRDR